MTNGRPTLYDLFDETRLQYWERLAKGGIHPNRKQLATLIEANMAEPLPSWLNPLILKGLRGELKGKPGRPKKGLLDQCRLELAAAEYKRLLRERTGPKRINAKRPSKRSAKGRALEPQHERAAKIAMKTWGLRMSWRSFLNEITSKNSRRSILNDLPPAAR
jgi:hypothetical protein